MVWVYSAANTDSVGRIQLSAPFCTGIISLNRFCSSGLRDSWGSQLWSHQCQEQEIAEFQSLVCRLLPKSLRFRSWIEYSAHTSGGKGFFVLVGASPGSDMGWIKWGFQLWQQPKMTAVSTSKPWWFVRSSPWDEKFLWSECYSERLLSRAAQNAPNTFHGGKKVMAHNI